MTTEKYVQSLDDYLTLSSEDEINVKAMLNLLSTGTGYFDTLIKKQYVTCLDIGSGNGAKSIYFAKELLKKGIKLKIDAIEPKLEQRQELLINHKLEDNQFLGDVYETAFDTTNIQKKYDIILIIHSLYEFPRNNDNSIASFDNIFSLVNQGGVGIILIEDEKSDFQKLKHELYPCLDKQEPVSTKVVEQTLQQHQIQYKQGATLGLKYPLGDISLISDMALGKNIAFLLSDSLEKEEPSHFELERAGKWVRDNVLYNNQNQAYLNTPNAIFLIYQD